MKIDIITLSCARNYGAMLQTYGLYQYLKQKGNDVYIIDYVTERYNFDAPGYEDKLIGKHRIWGRNALTRFLWRISYHRAAEKARAVFRGFLEEHVKLTNPFYSNEELKRAGDIPDIYITGSDQIWNPDFSFDHKIDEPYFLNFADENVKKLAYSSSFGKSELSEADKLDVYKNLSRFYALGVREKSGKEIIEDLGLTATVVADPTLLLNAAEWGGIATKSYCDKPYLLLFQITPSQPLMKFAKKMAEEKELQLIIVSPDYMHKLKIHMPAIYVPSVEEWVSYLKNADFIITDSFHATVFATIFEKQFYTAMFAGYNTRLSSYLEILGLIDRSVTMKDISKNQVNRDIIRYDDVTSRRVQFVDESMKWLDEQLRE